MTWRHVVQLIFCISITGSKLKFALYAIWIYSYFSLRNFIIPQPKFPWNNVIILIITMPNIICCLSTNLEFLFVPSRQLGTWNSANLATVQVCVYHSLKYCMPLGYFKFPFMDLLLIIVRERQVLQARVFKWNLLVQLLWNGNHRMS